MGRLALALLPDVLSKGEDNNYYKVHRLLMPDGSQFILDEKRDTAETAGGVRNDSGLSPTDNVSKISISELFSKINLNDKKFLKYVPDELI